jgi:MOSC domain-containing protein YiiM
MWNELYELLLGLAGAIVGLAAVYFFIAHSQGQAENSQESPQAGPALESDSSRPSAHEPLHVPESAASAEPFRSFMDVGPPCVVELYTSPEAGAPMARKSAVEAVAGRGLAGDRYLLNKGYWSESDECEVTMIAQEHLEDIMSETGLDLANGRHRRNLVTRNIDLDALIGRRFQIGSAGFAFARRRPPCLYLQRITEPGVARSLVGRGGIGVHCFKSGTIRENDQIAILEVSLSKLLRRRLRSILSRDDDPM